MSRRRSPSPTPTPMAASACSTICATTACGATTAGVPGPLAPAPTSATSSAPATASRRPSGVNLINNAAPGGAKEDRVSTPDQDLDGALCLRSLATGKDAVTGTPLGGDSERPGAAHRRRRRGYHRVRQAASHVPAIFVTGRNDGILPPNFASRAYFGLNNVVEGSDSSLHYYEVTNAHHLDSFNQFPGYNAMFIPLHRYFLAGDGPDVRPSAARAGVAAEPGRAHDAAWRWSAADHGRQRAADRRHAAVECADHLRGWSGEDSELKALRADENNQTATRPSWRASSLPGLGGAVICFRTAC